MEEELRALLRDLDALKQRPDPASIDRVTHPAGAPQILILPFGYCLIFFSMLPDARSSGGDDEPGQRRRRGRLRPIED